nr:hypothetical protein [Tanacetum cinerariifolium]
MVNDVMHLQALTDRKKVIINEATIREALRLDDDESIDCLPNEKIFIELPRMGPVRNVDSSTKFYMYPRFLQLMFRALVGDLSSHTIKYSSPALTQKVFANMRRAGKGFSKVETPLFKGMIVAQQADDVADEGVAGVDVDVVPAADAEPCLPSPTPTIQPPPPSQELPSTSQVIPTPPPSPIAAPSSPPQQQQPSQPIHDAEISLDLLHTLMETDDELEPPELKEVVTTAKLIIELVTAAAATITAATTLITATTITVAPSAARRRKGNAMMKYQALKRKPQIEAQARKNMMIYLRNMAGFKIDYFKGMSYDDIRPIFKKYFNFNVAFLEKTKEQLEEEESRVLKRTSESSKEKAAQKQKLDEEPKNFSDGFLLTTRTYMFEKPAVKAQVWKSQRGIYGLGKVKSWRLLESCGVHIITLTTTQMILLVERRYPLTRFTLDQMLNNVQLEVEEESEVSLELLRFVRQ